MGARANLSNSGDSAEPAKRAQARQFVVGEDDAGIRLDRWFKRHLPQIGFATVSRWARTGQIRLDGKRVRPDSRIEAGQTIRIPPQGESAPHRPRARARLSAQEIAEARAMVIAETASAIVLNKPPGLATQGGSKTHRHVDRLLDAFVGDDTPDAPRPRLVHRLDKDTSGVLLIARTPGAAAAYSKRFSSRRARKIYWALVVGVPEVEEGTIDAPLAKQPGTGGEKMHVDPENGVAARTRYRVVERAGNRAAWVELEPLTGRTHQLRVHMAAIGHPIVGDGKYGGREAYLTGAISRKMHLHARRLIIEEPEGASKGGKSKTRLLDVTAPLPDHFAASMAQLGFDPSASDARPLDFGERPQTAAERKAAQKRAARAHARDYRRARKGERRARASKNPGAAPGRAKPKRPKKRPGRTKR